MILSEKKCILSGVVAHWRLEVGGWRLEVGSRKQEASATTTTLKHAAFAELELPQVLATSIIFTSHYHHHHSGAIAMIYRDIVVEIAY